MTPSFREILKLLNTHEVEYIVVGGVAAVIHGAPVTTFDLDALVRTTTENAQKLIGVLGELDARYREHKSVIRPTEKDIVAGGHLLLITRAGPFDVLGYIGDHTTYEDLEESTELVTTDAGQFLVLGLDELIRQKRKANRSKDRAALELLEALSARNKRGD